MNFVWKPISRRNSDEMLLMCFQCLLENRSKKTMNEERKQTTATTTFYNNNWCLAADCKEYHLNSIACNLLTNKILRKFTYIEKWTSNHSFNFTLFSRWTSQNFTLILFRLLNSYACTDNVNVYSIFEELQIDRDLFLEFLFRFILITMEPFPVDIFAIQTALQLEKISFFFEHSHCDAYFLNDG